MRVGLLSDIHGNADALTVVLSAAHTENVSRILCCGDYVGYYYAPGEVIGLLDAWDWRGVRGNHEDMLTRWISGNSRAEIRAKYGSGLAKAAALPTGTISRIVSLPDRLELLVDGRSVLVCHGAPWAADAYVYPNAPPETWARMAEGGHDLIVHGHTHYPVVRQHGKSVIVNPGSVGQPRDRQPGACWALWDTTDMSVTLRRENYDPSRLVARCALEDPDLPAIGQILTRTA